MTSKHTPGPWIVNQFSEGTVDVIRLNGELKSRIARLHVEALCDEHGGCVDSNARLIAAAPDLLNALRHCLLIAEVREHPAVAALANAAIAKATQG